MGNKTSHRRKHLKHRDPMAQALESPIFRPRRVERKRADEARDSYEYELDEANWRAAWREDSD